MAQFNITATSAKKERTVTNADTNTRKSYASPAECADQAAADALAAKYAKDLNAGDFDHATDWVGAATAV
jgi:thiamine pyrophosphokinase